MEPLAFGSTSQRANYIIIPNQSDQQCCQQNSSKLQILCPPYLKNGFSSLNFFLYSLLMLLNLTLISFWEPSAVHFTCCIIHILRLIRSFLNVLNYNFIFSSFLPRLFLLTNFSLIR
ncbi:hypothetical protein O3M35_005452 [Rhynocoris fuscipes]|uniref:Uncharacterized protein n=1 Tax=Rhynocoris fuscipes TaxID=488301 RepID=A0AAW1DKF1_9HEMI